MEGLVFDDEGEALLDEGSARVLGSATANDVKALTGTGEGHVEQVEVVDGVLQVLVQVVGLVDGAHHLLLTIVDRGNGQVAERRFGGRAPEDVAALLLELPVAERTDDVVVLESLRLMDAEDAHTLGLVALDGLAAEALVPLEEEGADIGRVLADEVGQTVVEGADVGTLILETVQFETGEELFCEVVEWETEQFAEVADIGVGQQVVEVVGREQQRVVVVAMAQHVALIALHEGCLREQVVGMDEEPHGPDQEADGIGGVEAEGFVGDDGHLRHLLHEVVGDEGDIGIGAHEDGDILLGNALGDEVADGVDKALEHLLLVVVGRQQPDIDVAAVLPMVRDELLDVGIGALELFGLRAVELLLVLVFELGRMAEEHVVEGDDTTVGTVVGLQGQGLDLLFAELLTDIVEQSPVA